MVMGLGAGGGGEEMGKQTPFEAFHQKSNEPYFMNAMVFYDLPCNALKCLGPKPALSASFLPVAGRGGAIFATTDVIL